jgi:hypothetical protein
MPTNETKKVEPLGRRGQLFQLFAGALVHGFQKLRFPPNREYDGEGLSPKIIFD